MSEYKNGDKVRIISEYPPGLEDFSSSYCLGLQGTIRQIEDEIYYIVVEGASKEMQQGRIYFYKEHFVLANSHMDIFKL